MSNLAVLDTQKGILGSGVGSSHLKGSSCTNLIGMKTPHMTDQSNRLVMNRSFRSAHKRTSSSRIEGSDSKPASQLSRTAHKNQPECYTPHAGGSQIPTLDQGFSKSSF